jgi:hypothetical protein
MGSIRRSLQAQPKIIKKLTKQEIKQSKKKILKRTATALVRVTENLRSAKAEGQVTVHVLLDFSKAFDLINLGLFVHKLNSRYDFHTSTMGMVSSFLRDRSMVVEVDGVKSTPRS